MIALYIELFNNRKGSVGFGVLMALNMQELQVGRGTSSYRACKDRVKIIIVCSCIVGVRSGSVDFLRDSCNNADIVAETIEDCIVEIDLAVAFDIVSEKEKCCEKAKCFCSTRVDIFRCPRCKTYSLPEFLIVVGNNPRKAALFRFLDRGIADY